LRFHREHLSVSRSVRRRAGISCVVILPAGKIATGKLLQAFVYAAKSSRLMAISMPPYKSLRELGESGDFTIVNFR